MANPNNLHSENVPGPWYVDESCIICRMCSELAPDTFRESIDGAQNIVHRQPVTSEELAAAEEAMSNCPTDSIGNNAELPISPAGNCESTIHQS